MKLLGVLAFVLISLEVSICSAQTLSPTWTYQFSSNFLIDAGDEHVAHFDKSLKQLRILKLATGELLWEEMLDVENFIVDGQLLFLFRKDLILEARKLSDGQILWSKTDLLDGFREDFVRLEPTPQTLLIQRFQSRDVNYEGNNFIALNKRTGETSWTWQPAKSDSSFWLIGSTQKNHIFKTDVSEQNTNGIRDNTTHLYAVNQHTGALVWSQSIFQASFTEMSGANIVVSSREAERYGWTHIDANTGKLRPILLSEFLEYYGAPDKSNFLLDEENLWLFTDTQSIEEQILARFNLKTFVIEEWLTLPSNIYTVADFYSSQVKIEAAIQFYYPPIIYSGRDFVPNPTPPKIPFALHSLNLNTKEEKYFLNALRKEVVGNDWYSTKPTAIYHAWSDMIDDLLFWSDDFGYVMVYDNHSTELLISQAVTLRHTDHKVVNDTILLWGYDQSEITLYVYHR